MEIFHGGCLGCTNQDFYDLAECVGCQYYPENGHCDWDKPNNFSDAEIRKEYDHVTDGYYALRYDEKIVHLHNGYELDEQGEPFQPLITRIVRKDNVNDVRWESPDGIKNKTIQEFSVSECVEPPKEFGLMDELQKETNDWLNDLNLEAV